MEPIIRKDHRNSGVQRSSDEKPLGILSIPHARGVSEKFKIVSERYNISTIFKTKQNLGSYLRKTKLIKDKLKISHCV